MENFSQFIATRFFLIANKYNILLITIININVIIGLAKFFLKKKKIFKIIYNFNINFIYNINYFLYYYLIIKYKCLNNAYRSNNLDFNLYYY